MKNVALALSSGGPRGFAYIGAIEVLQERGYRITSVAGSSAGALVGGIFAAGGLRGHTLVDGGLVNTFPLDLVERSEGDILVGFNVNRIDAESITSYMKTRAAITETGELLRERATDRLKDTLAAEGALLDKVRKAGRAGGRMIRERIDAGRLDRRLEAAARENNIPLDAADSYASVLQRSFGIMNHTIARLQVELYKPDILVNLPFDSYHGVYGYSHAEEIVQEGRTLMNEALDRYEAQAATA